MSSKKTAKVRRYGKPQFSEAQLRAFRARQEATEAARREAEEAALEAERQDPSSRQIAASHWGRIDEEYAMIRSDMVRLTTISVAMFALIIVLWVVLG